jgi:hypothetical protein
MIPSHRFPTDFLHSGFPLLLIPSSVRDFFLRQGPSNKDVGIIEGACAWRGSCNSTERVRRPLILILDLRKLINPAELLTLTTSACPEFL